MRWPGLARVLLVSALMHAPVPRASHALPPGRGWSRVDSLGPSLTSVRIATDSSGMPWTAAAHASDSDAGRGEWVVSPWTGRRFSAGSRLAAQGLGSAPEPTVAADGTRRLLWLSHQRDHDGAGRILLSELDARGLSEPDTVMEAWLQSSETAGAFGPRRSWVARCQQRFPRNETFGVRVRSRDRTAQAWRELPDLGVNEFTCSIAPLPGDEAMVVYAGESGLAWARTRGAAWADSGRIDTRPWAAAHPRLRLDPGGALSLLWTEKEWVHVSRYREGRWERGDSLRAAHPSGETFWAGWCEMSQDREPAPVLAWGDRGFGLTRRDVLCVAFPDSSGWSSGEEVPGTDGAVIPTVARDRFGDAWLAWSHPDRPGAFVIHSVVTAITDTPQLDRRGASDRLSWTLSERAPGSHWTVERASGASPFAPVGRVRAGRDRVVEWSGEAPSTPVRYRVRRESVDERYAWTSPETRR